MISPNDRDLINEGSEVRRKYFDSVISQFDKIYLDDLISYNKALLQRNILLKKFAEHNYFDDSSIEIWDDQLVKYGERIHSKRQEFILEFTVLFQHFFDYITDGKEKVEIRFISHLNEKPLAEWLALTRNEDRQSRYTTAGIHKDDFYFSIDKYPVKRFGSQGQQKSFVIAVKLAQFDYTRNINGFKPIVLLDDIFDKLDDLRVKQIINLVSKNNFGQTFITDTRQERVENIFKSGKSDHLVFEITSGIPKLIA
jgi:DNA replication and repair protein RecF